VKGSSLGEPNTIAIVSFIGFVAVRLLGARRGLIAGAALGGLVSSTAVTLSFANRTKESPALAPTAAGAIAIAWIVMLARVGVLVAVVDAALLPRLALPLGAMTAAALLGLLLVFRRDGASDGPAEVKNPFELGSAIKVTLVFALVLLASKAAITYFGDRGLYLASALGGTTDVDAVTVSTAKLARDGLDPLVAVTSIAIAIAVNTIVKTGLAAGVGGAQLGRRTALVGLLVIAAGAISVVATALA